MAQNLESPKTKKSFSPFSSAIILVLVVVVAVSGYVFFRSDRITGLEVALRTATFLDKAFQPDGKLFGGFECEKSASGSECPPIPVLAEHPHTGQAIFGYFLLAEASGDPSYREKADKAINYVLDACETNLTMCEWNFFPLTQYYQVTKEEKYLTRGMLPPAEKFLAMSDYDTIITNTGHKLAALYTATKDERFLKRIVGIADAELQKPIESNNLMFQIIWSVYLPVYKITGDPKYLLASREFFDNNDVAKRIKREEFKDVASIAYLVKAADALLSLAELGEKRDIYRAQAQSILQVVLNKLWDTPENPKFTGDYGFIEDTLNENKSTKETLFNGWLIKVFVLMKDAKFDEPRPVK